MAADTLSGSAGQTPSYDWVGGAFGLANTGLQTFGSIEVAKQNAKILQRAQPANVALIVGGIAVLAVVLVIALK